MRRREFLGGLAAAVATALTACATDPLPTERATSTAAVLPSVSMTPEPSASSRPIVRFGPPTGITRVAVPNGTLTALPGTGNLIALTVDDGTDPAVLRAYAILAARTGLRLTFFANGSTPSWAEHADLLRPLVDDNQVLIANHTWSHPDLTKLGDRAIVEEVRRNENFLWNAFAVVGRPFLRPPFGYHNWRVDRLLSDLGYPAVTMWEGSLGDSTVQPPALILANAKEWFLPQHIVIGHANHPPVLEVLDQIVDIIRERELQPVHLGDVFSTS